MQKRCCQNCMYALRPQSHWLRVILSRWPGLFVCFNHADAPGRMQEAYAHRVCRNFRPRHWPAGERRTPPPPPDENTCYIPLTHGEVAMVDAADYPELSKYKWHLTRNRYACRREKGKYILMHRQIMKPPKGMVIDHIDCNGLNCHRSNMRICTPAQNNCNVRPRNHSSQFKGVSLDKRTGKYKATVGNNGKKVQIGEFKNEVEAALARDAKAREVQGPYAYENIPIPDAIRAPTRRIVSLAGSIVAHTWSAGLLSFAPPKGKATKRRRKTDN